eukprot:TRINITY_DN13072_c0_g1_i1.p1 TRINITY_DN13072_c0_g1~~TRINITY_DN13072_c0_g1_i1.p1  ORF type:complete len:4043 (+),score=569.27 TRINITY_DN13072_c0_g1_i1:111-12239(+)
MLSMAGTATLVVLVAVVSKAAAAGTCSAPLVGPMHDASQCGSSVSHCGQCTVKCTCGTSGNDCFSSNTLLRCLGEGDSIRQLPPDQFKFGTCNASHSTGLGLVSEYFCGVAPCCPASPSEPIGCQDFLDHQYGVEGQCQDMVNSGEFPCDLYFCPTCGPMAGKCDKACGYGACAVCGDCWPEKRLGVDQGERCDDGNLIDGDGCSSTCFVEKDWQCTRTVVEATSMQLGLPAVMTVDTCERCNSQTNWVDIQGYTCEDYAFFGVCDASSRPSDAVVIGGRGLQTPGYLQYNLVYDIAIEPGKPLEVLISVQAAANAHIFLGRPGQYGFELVIGGWQNGLSVLRKYPGRQELNNYYGEMLNSSAYSHFWMYCAYDGTFSLGRGHVMHEDVFLDGSHLTQQAYASNSWFDVNTNMSLLDQVHVSTGWQSTGVWDLRIQNGSASPSLIDLAVPGGDDASVACCACGGGVTGRQCDAKAEEPRKNVATSRKLANNGHFDGEPIFIGKPSTDGFTLRMLLKQCNDPADPCHLDAIVVLGRAKHRVITPFEQVWTQLRVDTCRLRNMNLTGTEFRWTPTNCGLQIGENYGVALYLKPPKGSASMPSFFMLDLDIPKPPSIQAASVQLVDKDFRPEYMYGEVLLQGAADESDILQYRLYFGETNESKVSVVGDSLVALLGWINTYGGGGLRNGFDNECLYGDCKWMMRLAKSAGNGKAYAQYVIKHEVTNECLCYRSKQVVHEPCDSELAVVDAALNYQYPVAGGGALVDWDNQLYKTVWYRDIGPGKNRQNVHNIMQNVCSDFETCVGYMIAEESLDGCLMFDYRYGTDEFPGPWTPPLHPLLVKAGAEQAWHTYEFSQARPPAHPARTSLDSGDWTISRQWVGWTSFRKEPAALECLWSVQDRIFNGTLESRLVNSQYGECACQVPVSTSIIGEDGEEIPGPKSGIGRELRVGKFCSTPYFGFSINGQEARTTGYCEWVAREYLPTGNATVTLDALFNDTGPASTDSTDADWTDSWKGAAAWNLQGDTNFELPNDTVGAGHAFAMWVDLQGLASAVNSSDGAVFTLFNSTSPTGEVEPCFQLAQRRFLDGRAPYCTGDYLCNGTDFDRCCGMPGGPTTITSTTTTTFENATNSTDEPVMECSACSCPINITEEVAEEIGTPLKGDKWALQLMACGSEAAWDSGADIMLPPDGSSSWILLVAVGHGNEAGYGNTTFYASSPTPPSVLTYESSFGCSTPGCKATAILRDIPRDPSRTCALEVHLYITNFANGISHDKPEVIEVITVRGGAPEWSRDIRFMCHPDANNAHDRLFPCVTKYNVDDWVLSLQSDRALRVDIQASPAVDEFPKDGMFVSGVAKVSCPRLKLPDRNLPKSGSIREVGKVERTCSGAVLQSVGGSTWSGGDVPEMYLGQAWFWNRALSKEEVESLHLGTRTRYYPDYQLELKDRDVVHPGEEILSTGKMYCAQPGCVASTMLVGLPGSADATCALTVDVALTDFSSSTEIVEWIKIDGHTVVENCWPGGDDDQNTYYRCADQVDVSQSLLRSIFLRDGEAEVSAKISDDVDKKEFRWGNRWYLYALVEVQCWGFTPSNEELPKSAVKLYPEVTSILTYSANGLGEGAAKATTFFDTVNGFKFKPRAINPSTQAVLIEVDAEYYDGQFWMYAVDKRNSRKITAQDMISGFDSDIDICSRSQRRRGHQTFEKFKQNPVLSNCEFEPGIEYTVVMYLDRAHEPFGGGVIEYLDIVGPYPNKVTGKPLLRPRKLEFEDSDATVKRISGTLTITSAASEHDITHYVVYFGRSDRIASGSTLPIATISASGAPQYTVQVVDELDPDVNTLIVKCKNENGESENALRTIGILDLSMSLVNNPLVEPVFVDDRLDVRVTLLMTDTGSRVDMAVVPRDIEHLIRDNGDYATLDYGPISRHLACAKAGLQFDPTKAVRVLTDCKLEPGREYVVVVLVAIRYACPCQDPCYCTGTLSTAARTTLDSGFEIANGGYLVFPDTVPPTLSLECLEEEGCKGDHSLRLTASVTDIGLSYPVLSFCAACLPPEDVVKMYDPPPTCLRSGDSEKHRYWRVRIPQGGGCDTKDSIGILEINFFEVSELEPSGVLVEPKTVKPIALVPELAGMDKKTAFDGSMASQYTVETLKDAWVGLDLGNGNSKAMLRARIHWTTTECVAKQVALDWSDDRLTWKTKILASEPQAFPEYTDVFVNSSAADWNHGATYKVVYFGEASKPTTINGVTPGTLYNIHCWSTDDKGNSGDLDKPLQVKTADRVGPYVEISSYSASDFVATLDLSLRDPGKAYPAMSTCIAREFKEGEELPPLDDLTSQGQLCHYQKLKPVDDRDGRIPMTEVFRSRINNQPVDIKLQQNQWGGDREDFRSCGLRQEPMFGPGGCTAKGGSKQKAVFVFTVRAEGDVYLFLGEQDQLGYEILVGGWKGERIAVSRGYARTPENDQRAKGIPDLIMDYAHPSGEPITRPDKFNTWWFEVDPATGLIRLGADDIIGHNILISHVDPFPIQNLDALLVGAGYWSAGPFRTDFPEVFLCPSIGNLLQGRKITSSSVAFGGSAVKAVDGQWGDNTFCEYCAEHDVQHVCASTRRQDIYNAPFFRIAMGKRYHIGAIRLVVPADGRPEQSSKLAVYVGNTGFRSDSPCTVIDDARGDNVWPCDPEFEAKGTFVSIWGNVRQLEHLPEEFGLRVCEIQAYVKHFDVANIYFHLDKFDRGEGMQKPFNVNDSHQVQIGGLQPNKTYEVFCYGEDDPGNRRYGVTDPVKVHTSDTTPPKVSIDKLDPHDQSIQVTLSLDDPGEAYPAVSRCIATTMDGRAPQEHERYFEHRFWRMRFPKRDYALSSDCQGRILLRAAELQSHDGRPFKQLMFGPEDDPPEALIGMDTDGDGIGDTPEIARWNLPSSLATIGIDLEWLPEADKRVMNVSSMLVGDLSVTIWWEGSPSLLDLSVIGPGEEYLENNISEGDIYRVSDFGVSTVQCLAHEDCTQSVRSVVFPLATFGEYEVSVYRRADWSLSLGGAGSDDEAWKDITINVMTRICGEDKEFEFTLPADEHNSTVVSGLKVQQTGCHRPSWVSLENQRSWQSTTRDEVPANKTVVAVVDSNTNTCIETGGEGVLPPDPNAWWRTSLDKTKLVKGVWLSGKREPGVAQHADIFVSSSTALLGEGMLCAEDVPIGAAGDPMEPPRPIPCKNGTRGSTVWVVAKPAGKRLNLCEVEILSDPLPTVTQAKFDFGRGNLTDQICGTPYFAVEYSDDNDTWKEAWNASADPLVSQIPQTLRWGWWQRLFSLPFTATFHKAETRNLTIPYLRENTTYDVMCWASDSLGNDISKDLVALAKPWAETRKEQTTDAVDYPGAKRRLLTNSLLQPEENASLLCDSWIREFLPCAEKVLTSDATPPKVLRTQLLTIEQTAEGYLYGANYQATWAIEMNDGSCDNRMIGFAVCAVRCEIQQYDLVGYPKPQGSACLYPRCVKKRWSNEFAAHLVFSLLRPGSEYTLICDVSDPWGNTVSEEFSLEVPVTTTAKQQSKTDPMYTAPPRPTLPPTTTPPTTTPRPTETAEYWAPSGDTKDDTQGPSWQSPPSPPPPTTTRYRPPLVYGTTTTRAPLVTQRSRATLPPTTTKASQTLPSWVADVKTTVHVRAELLLETSTQEEAYELMYPLAVKALEAALRSSLALSLDDKLEIIGMDLIPGGQSGHQRRLSAWQVLVRFTVSTASKASSQSVQGRIAQLGGLQSDIQSTFIKEVTKELQVRGHNIATSVVGTTQLQGGTSWSDASSYSQAEPSTSTPTSEIRGNHKYSAPAPAASEERSSPEGDQLEWLVPVAVGCGVLCLLTLAGGALYVCLNATPDETSKGTGTGKVADASRTSGANSELPSSHLPVENLRRSATVQGTLPIAGLPSTTPPRSSTRVSIQTSQRPSHANRSRTSQGRIADRKQNISKDEGDVRVHPKEAWSLPTSAGGSSRCSTASGNSSVAQQARQSSAATAPQMRTTGTVSDEMELQSCTDRVDIGSPSAKLPLHGKPPTSGESLSKCTERPESSGTKGTID